MAMVLRPAATVSGHVRASSERRRAQPAWPAEFDYDASQRLVEAVAAGDAEAAFELLRDPSVDVNFAGAVWIAARRVDDELRVLREEIRADVSPLFLAAGAGDIRLVRALLDRGADVNGRVFRGYATTAAAAEGQADIAELLVRACASQPACEEAVVEAALQGQAELARIFMGSDLVRPHVAVHALVSAATRGFVDVVDTLLKCGVDPNAVDRVLLRSSRPSLHANVDCTALFAAIVSRQVSVVRRLLQAGVRTDTRASLGAWSWDEATGEELRVGAGLAEPYTAVWCAVEYFESTGAILHLLVEHAGYSLATLHLGRSLLHHAILCGNAGAVKTLIELGADVELSVKTFRGNLLHPLGLASRIGLSEVAQILIVAGCNVDARAKCGDTPVILCSRHKHLDCLKVLVSAGADLGLVNSVGDSAAAVAASGNWTTGFSAAVLGAVRSGIAPKSSDRRVFSALLLAATFGDMRALEVLLKLDDYDIDELGADGLSPVMAAAKGGHVDAFRVLVFAGANIKMRNRCGESAISLVQGSDKRDLLEEVMLEFTLDKGRTGWRYALHFASRKGNIVAVRELVHQGCDVDAQDDEGFTPLMLAAREGQLAVAQLLLASGARCDIKTSCGETALSLASKSSSAPAIEVVELIMDELGRALVLSGSTVMKHTKGGRGRPHCKTLCMVGTSGVLRWGRSSRRNIVCCKASVGGSPAFRQARKGKVGRGDDVGGLFHVVTSRGREMHFVCTGGKEAAELWVRGIMAVTGAAVTGGKVE